MSRYYCEIDCSEYNNEEEACEAAFDYIDTDDLEEAMRELYTIRKIIKELGRLDSPMYYEIIDQARIQVFNEWFHEIEEEEEE